MIIIYITHENEKPKDSILKFKMNKTYIQIVNFKLTLKNSYARFLKNCVELRNNVTRNPLRFELEQMQILIKYPLLVIQNKWTNINDRNIYAK